MNTFVRHMCKPERLQPMCNHLGDAIYIAYDIAKANCPTCWAVLKYEAKPWTYWRLRLKRFWLLYLGQTNP